MFNRQFSPIAIAILLLSPSLVCADEIDGDPNLTVGNVQIVTSGNLTTIVTPKIQISTPKIPESRLLISRTHRRSRANVVRRTRTSTRSISIDKKVNADLPITVTTTTYPIPGGTTRSSTIRSSSNGSQSVSEQQQSIQCSNNSGGSVVSQSTATVNGRTISSEVRTNCN
jgi:hypothetical protein